MNSLVPFGGGDLLLKEQVDHITLREVESLKRACDIAYERSKQTENYKWIRDRDKLLLQVLWTTGARVSDVVGMESTNIKFMDKTIKFLVHKRKSHKTKTQEFWHTITLDPDTVGEIMDYMQTWNMKGFLFPHKKENGEPLTRQAVNKKLNQYVEFVGLRHIHPHEFRHGLAMYLQAQGVPVETIAFRLAHSSTAITLKTYARMSATQERNVYEALNVKLR